MNDHLLNLKVSIIIIITTPSFTSALIINQHTKQNKKQKNYLSFTIMPTAKSQRLEALEKSARLEIERDSVVEEIGDCDRTLAVLQEQMELIAKLKASWVEQKREEQRKIHILNEQELIFDFF